MSKDIGTLPVPQAFFAPLILLKHKPLRLSVHFYTILPATLVGPSAIGEMVAQQIKGSKEHPGKARCAAL
jgi:hypothetical protein